MNKAYFKTDVRTVKGVLRRVLKIYGTANWIRGSLAAKSIKDAGRSEMNADDQSAKCFCLRGAILASSNNEYLTDAAGDELWQIIKTEYKIDENDATIMCIPDWNDKVAKNKQEVLTLVKKGIEVCNE